MHTQPMCLAPSACKPSSHPHHRRLELVALPQTGLILHHDGSGLLEHPMKEDGPVRRVLPRFLLSTGHVYHGRDQDEERHGALAPHRSALSFLVDHRPDRSPHIPTRTAPPMDLPTSGPGRRGPSPSVIPR
eukprot:750003-Hanusia_phi.AAC.2